MSATRKVLEDTQRIFSILHDGIISAWSGDKELLTLKVDCGYLAARIDASYKSFFVECDTIQALEFYPWKYPDFPPILLTDINEIFKTGLTIVHSKIDADLVKVTCVSYGEYSGGELLLSCGVIRIFDEATRPLPIEEIDNIRISYWQDWANGNDNDRKRS